MPANATEQSVSPHSPVYGFLHVAARGRWREVVDEQLGLLRSSGLYDRAERLFVGVVGCDGDTSIPADAKIEIVHRSPNLQEYEFPTLRALHRFCLGRPDAVVFYVHTKGVVHVDTPQTTDWRRYMEYFVVERYAECLDALREHDVCGVDWFPRPWPHFSGNFWWARADYVARLTAPDRLGPAEGVDETRRHNCERWIGSDPAVRAACLHQSRVDHYGHRHPRAAYASGMAAGVRVAVIYDDVVRPDTTGVYCLRAMGQLARAEHVSPQALAAVTAGTFDLHLYVDDGLDYDLRPDLRPSALWAIDTHINPARLIRRAATVDLVFAAQRDGVDVLRGHGINCAGWLPLACDPAVHRRYPVDEEFDVCFVAHCSTAGRRELADLVRAWDVRSFVGQRFFADMARTYSASKVALNLSVRNDVNMRVFEALACGTLLLTNDLTANGLADLFRDGEHLVTYADFADLRAKLDRILADPAGRARIAAAGRDEVLARHTYVHRMRVILDAAASLAMLPSRAPRPPGSRPCAAPPTPVASVVIPVFNQLSHTRACLASLGRHTRVPVQLIVVDNGSTDGTPEYLATRPDVCVIRNAVNRGFPAAVNQGIRASAGARVVLLNNDATVTEGWLERMLSAMGSDPKIGLVGPKSNGVPGPQRVPFAAGGSDRTADDVAREIARENGGRVVDAAFLGGFCLLIARDVIARIGGFDEGFGLGTFDDYDFCGRARQAGFRCVIAADAYVHHLGAVTLNAINVDLTKLLADNETRFLGRYRAGDATGATVDAPLTSIVVVTYNQWEYTARCLESIRRCTPEPHEVIVVDNGSTDQSVAQLRTSPSVRLIENAENRGFPAAANQGIQAARGDQVLLLNNDVIVTPGWLGLLTGALRASPEIWLAGPCSNAVSGAQQVAVDYDEGDLADVDQFAAEWAARNRGRSSDVDRLVGFCLLFRRQLVDRIGLLDERFGIGNFEDDDFCRRVRAAGGRAVIARPSFVHHFGSVTFKASGVDYAALMRTNRELFLSKWEGTSLAPVPQPGRGADANVTAAAAAGARGSRPLLSLCMIARDSSRTIRPCLESVWPWVDEVIVVDTGSMDDTPEIAANAGATVHRFPWCDDFSAARNASLAAATGEWVFWMDSDDTIDEANGRKLRELVAGRHGTDVMGFVVQVHCPASAAPDPYATHTAVDHVKVFRNLPDIRFSGRIHEQVLPAIRRLGGRVEWTDIFVLHSGSDVTPEGRARKHRRDLRILELELAEDPDHTFTLFNIGMTLLDMGRAADALDPLSRSLQLADPGDSHVRKLYAMLAQAYAELGRRDTALRTCARGLALYADDPELLFRQGVVQHASGRPELAERSFRAILDAPPRRHFSSMDQGVRGIKVWHNLAIVFEQQKRHEHAADAWRHVLEYDRSNHVAWRGLLDALTHDDPGRALGALNQMNAPGDILLIARARLAVGNNDIAGAIEILEAGVLSDESFELLAELSEMAFRHGLLDAAERALTDLVRRRPDDAAAHQNLASVLLRLRDFGRAADHARASLRLRPGHVPAQELLERAQRAGGADSP